MNPDQINQLFAQFKFSIMMLLNETADEFDKRDLTDDQRRTYNDFTGMFGKKVLELKTEVKTDE